MIKIVSSDKFLLGLLDYSPRRVILIVNSKGGRVIDAKGTTRKARPLRTIRPPYFIKKGVLYMDRKPLHRVSSRLGHDLNDWLDDYVYRTGVSKSAIINVALEQFRRNNSDSATEDDPYKVYEELADRNARRL